MGLFFLKRLATLVATLIGASVVVFLVLEILPGNAAQMLMGPDASPDAVAPSEDVVPAGAAAVVAQPVRRRADAAARANAVRMRGTEVSWER